MGLSSQDRAGLDKSLKDLNLSNDELDKFTKAFKDPEFLKLFEDYAKEVSDPKVKEETDMYLRQLEFEGRMEEVYGKGAQLILPTPAFVIKTQDTADGSKVFINVCTSDKLDKASLKSAVNKTGQKGSYLDLPLCLGPKKAGTDKTGSPCGVWDFVVHPEALVMAATTPAIKKSMVEMAMEKIEGSCKGVTLHRGFREPRMTYKATEGCPKPHALAMRGSGSETVNGRVKPATAAAVVAGLPGAKTPATAASTSVTPGVAGGEGQGAEGGAGAGGRSKFAFPEPKQSRQAAAKAVPQEPSAPGYVHAGGEVTPQWEIIHRGQIDLSEAWGDAGRGMAFNTTHPKELVVRVQLPGVASASAAELDVSRSEISVVVAGRYKLVAALPFTVNSEMGRAKFDKSKQQLEVTVPVIPPPLPATPLAPSPLVAPVATAGDGEVDDDVDTGAERTETAGSDEPLARSEAQGTAAAAAEPAAERDAKPSHAAAASDPEEAAADHEHAQHAGDDAHMTENQRRWAELHQRAATDTPVAVAAAPSAAGQEAGAAALSVGAPGDEFIEARTFQGAKPGYVFYRGSRGVGYYKDVAPARAAPAEVSAPAPAARVAVPRGPKLQPRLNSALVADLD